MWNHMENWSSGWFGMGFGMLLFWGLAIAAIVLVIKVLSGPRSSHLYDQAEKTALDILRERYARGEIDRDEFEQKKRDLEK